MTGPSDKGGKKGPDEPASDARGSEGLDDLMTSPAAAMAAATAFGLGMAAQMGRLFLGSLQGAMEVTGQLARQLEEERKAAEAESPAEPDAKPEAVEPASPSEPLVPATSASTKVAKPAARQAKAKEPVKALVARVEKPKLAPKAAAEAEPKAEPVGKARPTAAKARPASKAETTVEAAAPAPKPKKTTGRSDDLKKIDGIGPKVEQILKGRGITRFQDLAAMDETALQALDTELGLDGRMLRDDWAGQALRLAGGKARSGR